MGRVDGALQNMRKYFLLPLILFFCLLLQPLHGADDLSSLIITDAKMPVYNNGKLTILVYSKTATRTGIDIILNDAILDIIKPGIDVDQIKYVDGTKPYPLGAPLKTILKFWVNIIHSDGLIFSHAATINQKTKNGRSREKIFFRSPVLDINGVGFQADFSKRTMRILSNVIIKIRQTSNNGKLMPGSGKKNKTSKTSMSTITSDEMFIDFTNNIITVSGNVKVDEENMTINCEKITVYMTQGNDKKSRKKPEDSGLGNLSSSGSGRRISKIVCEKNVVITRKQSLGEIKQNGQQQAFADRADYDFVKSKIVMTGKRPTIKRGTDAIEGKQITIWRDKEHLQAQGDCRLSFMAPNDKKSKNPAATKIPTVATSDFMDMNYAENLAVLTGNVKVVDPRMKIDCHKMNIYLEDRQKKTTAKVKSPAAKSTDKALSSSKVINKIVCIGDVTIFRLDGKKQAGTQKAMAGKAIYHLKEGKIILSENDPIIIRGRDSVSGKIITVWVDQQKMHVDQNSLIVLNNLKNKQGQQPAATRVKSDYTNIDYGRNLMSFAGQVKVNNPQMVLDCKKMLIFLEDKKSIAKKSKPETVKVKTAKSGDPLDIESSDKVVSKVICLGDVYGRDQRNDLRCQKLTLIMQDKQPGTAKKAKQQGQNANFGSNREISRIICKEDVVLVRRPEPAAGKAKTKQASSPDEPGDGLLAKGSDKPIIVKTDFMDLKLTENYGELIGNVDVDEPRVHLTCDKMELYAEPKPAKSVTKGKATTPSNPDDEFDNEDDEDDEVAGDGTVPKQINLGDDKQLEKIICRKNVVITRKITANDPIKQQATGDKAVYLIKKGKITMTENPTLRQGDNIAHYDWIILWTDSERLDFGNGEVEELELPDK
jgi:lipopolysaccharide export system protein LptA